MVTRAAGAPGAGFSRPRVEANWDAGLRQPQKPPPGPGCIRSRAPPRRRASREAPVPQREDEAFAHEDFFRSEGEWAGHWRQEQAPSDWHANPAVLAEQHEFWLVFQACLGPLPPRIASAFVMREVDGST